MTHETFDFFFHYQSRLKLKTLQTSRVSLFVAVIVTMINVLNSSNRLQFDYIAHYIVLQQSKLSSRRSNSSNNNDGSESVRKILATVEILLIRFDGL